MSQFIEVPQTPYSPPTTFHPHPSVCFSTNGSWGVNLEDAYYGRLDHLDNRNEPHGIQSGMRIAFRIMWPGYDEWVARNLTVISMGQNSTVHTMHKLVNTLATKVHDFYTGMGSPGARPGNDPNWVLQRIDFKRLYITELRHVSQGCWQPVLYYRSD
ncbi:hypothetical protein BDY19DRAFT_990976 [Irpex rosettiformis]|uniref:Uncharacterized protein n=1 Tax=Irpex rosettiformis TaxID=378272 RepID=A0ACB8UDC5_9APHY|nr:hypothetical protein BDY19DRAFT_990976 [Irpex rosettiformis]